MSERVATPSLASDLRQVVPGLRASQDEADRVAYARDLWPRHHLAVRAGRPAEHRPAAIVWPTSTEEVAAIVRWARSRGVVVVPFGAGSGVCAGVQPGDDTLIVDLKRMGRVRRLEPGSPLVEVEAGHMGVPLERTLGRAGLTLGHFPSSILCSSVGGWVAARSAGQCSGAYGKIEDMVVALECVTGAGDVVSLSRRTSGPDLVPLVVGSEGTLGIVTGATLRLHPAPFSRQFGAWSFPTTREGWEAMRDMFQAGLRPAVARLYDPLDALLARHARNVARGAPVHPAANGARNDAAGDAPGTGGVAMRAMLRRPGLLNELIHSSLVGRALGGAMLVVVFDVAETGPTCGLAQARRLVEATGGRWLGEAPARGWFERRYAVSYRQAPLLAEGLFVDTMEVAARWSVLGQVYAAVRRALGRSVLATAHFSHAYPDGCCIYFSFAGSADRALVDEVGWDAACETAYDRTWKAALSAASEAGATLAHHHGVGRSKAPRLGAELGSGVEVVRALMRAFDPSGILNRGNLLPPASTVASTVASTSAPTGGSPSTIAIDRESLLARVDGATEVAAVERVLNETGLTLDVGTPAPGQTLATWLAAGAPGARDRWLDPVDQLIAGFDATMIGGRSFSIRPAPRRSVGPDLSALLVGAHGRYGRIDRAFVRVHRRGVPRPTASPFDHPRDPPPSPEEQSLLEAIAREM
jgi:alkyldihydroxyacetonephosphate synthase